MLVQGLTHASLKTQESRKRGKRISERVSKILEHKEWNREKLNKIEGKKSKKRVKNLMERIKSQFEWPIID